MLHIEVRVVTVTLFQSIKASNTLLYKTMYETQCKLRKLPYSYASCQNNMFQTHFQPIIMHKEKETVEGSTVSWKRWSMAFQIHHCIYFMFHKLEFIFSFNLKVFYIINKMLRNNPRKQVKSTQNSRHSHK